MTLQEYEVYLYRRQLRSDVNKTGILLLIFFGAQQLFAAIVLGLIMKSPMEYFANGTAMLLLLNGMLSTVVFFLISLIYSSARGLSLARLLPFERIGAGALAALCVTGLTLALMSNMAAQAVTDVFSLFGITNRGGEISGSRNFPPVPLYYLTVAVLPALAEEFAFRGVIMGSLRKYSDAMALLVSSAAFALMHGNFVQIPFTFCCGLVFGFIVLKTNSLLPAIIIHFLNNALSVTTDVLYAYRPISVNLTNILSNSLLLVLVIASIFLMRRYIFRKPELFRFGDSDTQIPFRDKMKIAASTPTVIVFATIMLLYAIYVLVLPIL